jgi:hypothetical protein
MGPYVLDYRFTQLAQSIVRSTLSMDKTLQQVRENHLRLTCDRASDVNPEFSDGARWFVFDFGNPILAPKVNVQEDSSSPLAVHSRDNASSAKRKNKPCNLYCISNRAINLERYIKLNKHLTGRLIRGADIHRRVNDV